jgi:hypothetical protein
MNRQDYRRLLMLDISDRAELWPQPSQLSRSPPDHIGNTYYDNSTRKGGCQMAALLLKWTNDNMGDAYWVQEFEGEPLHHAYYVPDPSRLEDRALNQADNGYQGFPPLTVRQVIDNGFRYDIQDEIQTPINP